MDPKKGFFKTLFDFSFKEFVTPKLLKFLYGLGLLLIVIFAVVIIAASFNQSPVIGLLMLCIGAPLFVFMGVIYLRFFLELTNVLFHIAENISVIAKAYQRDAEQDGTE